MIFAYLHFAFIFTALFALTIVVWQEGFFNGLKKFWIDISILLKAFIYDTGTCWERGFSLVFGSVAVFSVVYVIAYFILRLFFLL